MAYIEVNDVVKSYGQGENEVRANDGVNFSIKENEFALIVGPSGAGKSTVLNLLGGMDSPDSGDILVDGKNVAQLSEKDLTNYRRHDVGFVFQNYNLIPNLTAKENVEMATEIADQSFDAEKILDSVGLSHRKDNFPAQLSGGEQQRVAIARALAKRPKLLLCDEPTGALDYETGKKILDILFQSIEDYDATVVVITHNRAITPMAHRVIDMADAKVRDIQLNPNPQPVTEIEW